MVLSVIWWALIFSPGVGMVILIFLFSLVLEATNSPTHNPWYEIYISLLELCYRYTISTIFWIKAVDLSRTAFYELMLIFVFCVVMLCGLVGRYKHFGETYCLHLHLWYVSRPCGFTAEKNINIFSAVRTSHLIFEHLIWDSCTFEL